MEGAKSGAQGHLVVTASVPDAYPEALGLLQTKSGFLVVRSERLVSGMLGWLSNIMIHGVKMVTLEKEP